MYADIIVNRPIQQRPPAGSPPQRDDGSWPETYTYRLPEHLREAAQVGHLVQVPLRTSTALGIIASLRDSPPPDLPPEVEIRDVTEILDPLPVVTSIQIELGRWIADSYLAPLSQAMRLMLPPGLEARTFVVVSQTAVSHGPLSAQESAALQVLRSRQGPMRLNALAKQLGADDPEAVVYALADKGLLEARYTLVPPKPAPPRVQYVRLLADDATVEAALPRLGHPSKQADALLSLARRTSAPLTVSELCALARCGQGPLHTLVEQGWIEITERRTLVVALPDARFADLGRAYKQAEVLSVLLNHGSPMEMGQLLAEAGASSTNVSALEKKGLVQRIAEEPLALLTVPLDRVLDLVIELRGAEKQQAVLQMLRNTTDRVWVGGIYAQTGADLSTLRDLANHRLISLHAQEYDRPLPTGPEAPPRLTADQEAVWQVIQENTSMQKAEGQEEEKQPFIALLHGYTGSHAGFRPPGHYPRARDQPDSPDRPPFRNSLSGPRRHSAQPTQPWPALRSLGPGAPGRSGRGHWPPIGSLCARLPPGPHCPR